MLIFWQIFQTIWMTVQKLSRLIRLYTLKSILNAFCTTWTNIHPNFRDFVTYMPNTALDSDTYEPVC